jgi:hypothetical protein
MLHHPFNLAGSTAVSDSDIDGDPFASLVEVEKTIAAVRAAGEQAFAEIIHNWAAGIIETKKYITFVGAVAVNAFSHIIEEGQVVAGVG